MSRKVLFFDIDGTLVESRLGIVDIPQTVKDEMKRLQGLGHKLFISSGRPRAMLNQEILEAGFDGYILANGAYVEIDGQSIYEDRMDATLAVKTMEMLEKLDCSYMIETAKHVYIDNYDVIQRTLKIEANVTDENREKVIDYIKNDFGYVVNYDEHGSENAFELYSPTISKAVGIQKVLEYYNLTKDDTYAFGDGINDLEMIQYCHVGVAMGNAVKELKDVADLICRRIDEDGLARILKILKEIIK